MVSALRGEAPAPRKPGHCSCAERVRGNDNTNKTNSSGLIVVVLNFMIAGLVSRQTNMFVKLMWSASYQPLCAGR
jgi:hypothetical protein